MTTFPPEPPTQPGAGQAVFVSDASRRARAVRWMGRIAALLAVAYVVMTAGGMVGASWVPRVSLPGVGPVTLEQHPGATPSLGTTAQQLKTPDLTRVSTGSGRSAPTTSTVVARTGGNAGATTTTPRSRSGSNPPSTNPGGNTPGGGKTSTTRPSSTDTSPGKSGSAPGHTSSTVAHGH